MSAAEMREAAAELAYDMATAYWDLPEGVDYSGEDLRALSDRIRALPLPDEEGMVERVARALCESAVGGRCACSGGFSCADEYPGRQARAAIRAINGGKP